jgi:hypothetical protein
MKTSILAVVIASTAFCVQGVYADDAHHPDKKGAPAKDAKAPMAKGMPMGMMQDKMLKMHEQMHKIMQAKDPKERDKLMQEHAQMMQEQMKMMGGMMGNGMMGPGMMGGDGKGGMTDAPAGK